MVNPLFNIHLTEKQYSLFYFFLEDPYFYQVLLRYKELSSQQQIWCALDDYLEEKQLFSSTAIIPQLPRLSSLNLQALEPLLSFLNKNSDWELVYNHIRIHVVANPQFLLFQTFNIYEFDKLYRIVRICDTNTTLGFRYLLRNDNRRYLCISETELLNFQ